MLKAIRKIQGVGLFYDASVDENDKFAEVTLIYAENARGKSTLASILGAAAKSDSSAIEERRTIDQDVEPTVELEFEKGRRVCFESKNWNGDASSLRVFDSDFIDRNVHSGSVIDVGHRRNLLELAVGEESVRAKRAQEALAMERKIAQAKLETIEGEIGVLRKEMSLAEFLGLPRVNNVDDKIRDKKAELTRILSKQSIANQEKPRLHGYPTLDVDALIRDLSCTLENLQDDAEAAVRSHIEKLSNPRAERWIAEGLAYCEESRCPFCGQDIKDVGVIAYFRSIFDENYNNFRESIDNLSHAVEAAVPSDAAAKLDEASRHVKTVIDAWVSNGFIVVASDSGGSTLAAQRVSDFRDAAQNAIERKRHDLNFVPSKEEIAKIRESYSQYLKIIEQENDIIQVALDAISEYLQTLGKLDSETIRNEIFRLEQAKTRHSAEVITIVEDYGAVKNNLRRIAGKIQSERQRERAALNDSLGKYAGRINDYLAKQFAPFRISDAGTSYSGGLPSTTYTIKVRGRLVNLKGSENTFKTALSESDKRSMAFAFFLAATLDDPSLSERTVVVDDPMSSLDRNRRANTIKTLVDIALRCNQLIVLAHDPKFLLDLDTEIRKSKKFHASDNGMHPIKQKHIKLKSVIVDSSFEAYTNFGDCDLPKECESNYARNYRTLAEFVSDPTKDHVAAANAMRPLLEGYLHRRFPGQLPRNCMFGQAIKKVREATGDSPLVNAQPQVEEMSRIAYFGNSPHHDSDIDYQPIIPSHTEIFGYAKECLNIVHGA